MRSSSQKSIYADPTRTSKHTTNDRYRAFCFFLWRLFPPIVKMAKTFDQLANRTFDLSCYSRDESQGVEVPTRNSAAYKGFKECFWPSLQAEAELHAENIQCGLDKVTQDEHQEWSDYQTRVERGILPSPEKLVCGVSGPPLSVCTINKLFHLLESSMTSLEGSLSLEERSTYRHDQLKTQTRVRVRPAIVLGMKPGLRHARVLIKECQELQEFSDTGANTTRVGGAIRLIQPWWHEGRWQAAIFDKESASLFVTLIDPWNQAGAEAIKVRAIAGPESCTDARSDDNRARKCRNGGRIAFNTTCCEFIAPDVRLLITSGRYTHWVAKLSVIEKLSLLAGGRAGSWQCCDRPVISQETVRLGAGNTKDTIWLFWHRLTCLKSRDGHGIKSVVKYRSSSIFIRQAH